MRENMKAALKLAAPRLTAAELDALTEAAVDVAREYGSECAFDAMKESEERRD